MKALCLHGKKDKRTETDSFGPIDVPGDALWGAQTERSRRFFAIGMQRMPLQIVHALAQIKCAAAQVNGELGLLPPVIAAAIAAAAERVAAGEFDDQFPLSVWQTGSGTQTHMNVNEVVAHLATLVLGGRLDGVQSVHPNDDVNRKRSANPSISAAMKLPISCLGNQRTGRDDDGSTTCAAVHGAGGGVPRLRHEGQGLGRSQRRADRNAGQLVRALPALAGQA